MRTAYFDESGDDGIPGSSDLFILSNLYMHERDWKDNFEIVHQFRKTLSDRYGFPVKLELHTNPFLKGKGHYWDYEWSAIERLETIDRFVNTVASLELSIINVAIDKDNIIDREDIDEAKYDVLDKALTYNLSRTERDLSEKEGSEKRERFIIITDKGRVAPMRRVSRMRQVYNPVKSRYGGTYQYRIKRLIEDPLPKDSKNSFFIQLADLMATIVLLYIRYKTNKDWSKQLPEEFEFERVKGWLEVLKENILNLKASTDSEYGIVYYPERDDKLII